jgi:hypothetical protein
MSVYVLADWDSILGISKDLSVHATISGAYLVFYAISSERAFPWDRAAGA